MAQPLHVLAVLATAQIVHAYPEMLSPSRSITAGSTILGCDVMLVLALLAMSRTAHAWPSRLSASRGITAGNIIMGKTVQQSSAGSARLGSVACGGSLTAGATMTMSLSGHSGQYIMEATGKRCSGNSMCTYTVPSSGSVTVRGAWATGSSGGVYVSPDCTYTVQAAVTCNTCEDGKYLSGCSGGSSGSCMTCAGCPAGKYRTGCSGTSAGACTSCGAGKYKTSSGSEACLVCSHVGCAAGETRSGCGGDSAGSCAAVDAGRGCNVSAYYAEHTAENLASGPHKHVMERLHALVSTPHTVIPYTDPTRVDCWDALRDLDADPAEPGLLTLIYSQRAHPAGEQGVAAGWNRGA